jgi:membrane fusion protein, multidrug efflux system
MQIRAPFSGRIENVSVELGSFVSFGTVLSQLIDNSSLKIDVYLSEQEAFKVKTHDEVTITSVVLTMPKSGTVRMISDKADAGGKFLAEIIFPNNDREKLKAGILVDVHFSADATQTGLSVPVSALLAVAKEPKVYVVNNGHAILSTIKTGIVTADRVEVVEGLRAGDQVIVSGQLNLENGSAITTNN